MIVNRYQIGLGSLTGSTSAMTINIPISMKFQIVDQAELIEDKFVKVETEKAINPIEDYEKVRFSPINNSSLIDSIVYNVTFSGSASTYGAIGFSDDDIKFRKNKFKLSFLRLNFYDTDRATDQRLVSYITLYPKIGPNNLHPLNVLPPYLPSSTKPANQIPISFELTNRLKDDHAYAEGFYVYHYKDEVLTTLPKELFMRASFNNAKSGKSTNLMIESAPQPIEVLVNRIYTKFILKKDATGYYYEVDTTYPYSSGTNHVSYNAVDKELTINLYEILAL